MNQGIATALLHMSVCAMGQDLICVEMLDPVTRQLEVSKHVHRTTRLCIHCADAWGLLLPSQNLLLVQQL